MSPRRLVAIPLAVVLGKGLSPVAAAACAVCYGAADSSLTQGMNNGILVLLGVVAAVQIGFVALFLSIRRRTRRLEGRRGNLYLIQGGAG